MLRTCAAALLLWACLAGVARAQNAFEFRRPSDNAVMATLSSSGALTATGLAVTGSSLTVIDPNVAADAYSLAVTTSANKSFYHLYVATNGSVGIGTGTVVAPLTVAGTIRSDGHPVWRLVAKDRQSTTFSTINTTTTVQGAQYTIAANSQDSEWRYRWELTETTVAGVPTNFLVALWFDGQEQFSFWSGFSGPGGDSQLPLWVRAEIWKKDSSSAVGAILIGGDGGFPAYTLTPYTGIDWTVSHTIKLTMCISAASSGSSYMDGMMDLEAR